MRFLLLCLFFPMVASAQKFDISISDGGTPTVFFNRVPAGTNYKSTPVVMPMLKVTAFKFKSAFAVGLELSAFNMRAKYDNVYQVYDERYSEPTIGLNFIIGAKLDHRKSRMIVGGQIGALYNKAAKLVYSNTILTHRNSAGGNIGFYFNYIYYIKRIGIGAEFTPRINIFSNLRGGNTYTALTLPVLIGVHLKL